MSSERAVKEAKSSALLEDTEILNNLDNVSKRLKYVVDTLGVKQSHLAGKLGVSPSGLHYILNNETRFSKNAKKIAEYLQINERWLATGEGSVYEENKSIKTFKIPLYYPDQLKIYFRSDKNSNMTTSHFMLTTTAYANKAIGIYVTETDFSPKFEVGDMMAFEEIQEFKEGEIVLVYLSKYNDLAIKHAFHVENEIFLISPSRSPIKLFRQDGDVIIGAYRECLKSANLT